MRNLTAIIYPRPGTSDNQYTFNTLDSSSIFMDMTNAFQVSPYEFFSASLNYSVQSSSVTSTLILSMNVPPSSTNVLRSGQPVEITDDGSTVFQGVILSITYKLLPMTENSATGGIYAIITLAPSIMQLTLTPMIFDSTQAQQVQALTGVNVAFVLAGGVAQSISTQTLLNYMISNTDYSSFFSNTLTSQDVPSSVFLMASPAQDRDSVLRASLDFTNVVIYQQENGQIVIRALDATIASPFNVSISNQISTNPTIPNIPMLQYEYMDNAASTASIVSNYNILSAGNSIANNISNNILSYTPNPTYYPRIKQLSTTGWFVGEIGQTQINDNIVSDPTAAEAYNGYQSYPDQYMNGSPQSGAKETPIAAYQALLTGKQLGQALTNYANLQGTISLDDPNIPYGSNLTTVLGSVIQIQGCDLNAGLIATVNRTYTAQGSYLSFTAVPLGSITGFWVK